MTTFILEELMLQSIFNTVTVDFFGSLSLERGRSHNSPVISCISEGTTEWQRFGCPKVFIRVPGVTIPKYPSIPLEENVLEHFEVCYRASALKK
jgi:hypothetical protein